VYAGGVLPPRQDVPNVGRRARRTKVAWSAYDLPRANGQLGSSAAGRVTVHRPLVHFLGTRFPRGLACLWSCLGVGAIAACGASAPVPRAPQCRWSVANEGVVSGSEQWPGLLTAAISADEESVLVAISQPGGMSIVVVADLADGLVREGPVELWPAGRGSFIADEDGWFAIGHTARECEASRWSRALEPLSRSVVATDVDGCAMDQRNATAAAVLYWTDRSDLEGGRRFTAAAVSLDSGEVVERLPLPATGSRRGPSAIPWAGGLLTAWCDEQLTVVGFDGRDVTTTVLWSPRRSSSICSTRLLNETGDGTLLALFDDGHRFFAEVTRQGGQISARLYDAEIARYPVLTLHEGGPVESGWLFEETDGRVVHVQSAADVSAPLESTTVAPPLELAVVPSILLCNARTTAVQVWREAPDPIHFRRLVCR
jgi:hypothetical protein